MKNIVNAFTVGLWFSLIYGNKSSCVFDRVKPDVSKIPSKTLSYTDKFKEEHRVKRDFHTHFQPIRIYVHSVHLDTELREVEQKRLKEIVTETRIFVENIFSVMPVNGSLLLARSEKACKRVYSSGPNKDKCAVLNINYKGETCLDQFPIPEEHLEGLYLWNETYPDPIQTVCEEGTGIENADYIMYVTAASTVTCRDERVNIIAYATYCQLDQNSRPIAGYVNFCPKMLRDPQYNKEKAKVTALHEMFHALGFSADLFPYYKRCTDTDGSYNCDTWSRVIEYVQGAKRMVTPNVVQMTSDHFGCTTHQTANEFGPIMQTDKTGVVLSHWDAAFMYSSVMTPTIGLSHLTVLDNITLAAFEDSGWYHVNYNYAEKFLWGKVGGCSFGLNPSCENAGSYFCAGSASGCHFLLQDKGRCETDAFLHNCYVYRAQATDTCLVNAGELDDQTLNVTGESYGTDSRCFVSSLNANESSETTVTAAGCYTHKCNGTDQLYVRVGQSNWILCPFGSKLTQVPGYAGELQCPKKGVLCEPEPVIVTTTTTSSTITLPSTQSTTTARHLLKPVGDPVICVDLEFSMLSLMKLRADNQETLFSKCTVHAILELTHISRHRINNILLLDGSVIFRFDLHPALYSDDGPASSTVLMMLSAAVRNGQFIVIMPTSNQEVHFSASAYREVDLGPTMSDKNPGHGVIAGAVIGAVLLSTVLGILVYFVQRYYTNHTRVIPNRREPQQVRPAARAGRGSTSGSNVAEPYAILDRNVTRMRQDQPMRASGRAAELRQGHLHAQNSSHKIEKTKGLGEVQLTENVNKGHESCRTSSFKTQTKPSSSQVCHGCLPDDSLHHQVSTNQNAEASQKRVNHVQHRLSSHSIQSSTSECSTASNKSGVLEGPTYRCSSAGTTVSAKDVYLTNTDLA